MRPLPHHQRKQQNKQYVKKQKQFKLNVFDYVRLSCPIRYESHGLILNCQLAAKLAET